MPHSLLQSVLERTLEAWLDCFHPISITPHSTALFHPLLFFSLFVGVIPRNWLARILVFWHYGSLPPSFIVLIFSHVDTRIGKDFGSQIDILAGSLDAMETDLVLSSQNPSLLYNSWYFYFKLVSTLSPLYTLKMLNASHWLYILPKKYTFKLVYSLKWIRSGFLRYGLFFFFSFFSQIPC